MIQRKIQIFAYWNKLGRAITKERANRATNLCNKMFKNEAKRLRVKVIAITK